VKSAEEEYGFSSVLFISTVSLEYLKLHYIHIIYTRKHTRYTTYMRARVYIYIYMYEGELIIYE
jgi:hypothetical protein